MRICMTMAFTVLVLAASMGALSPARAADGDDAAPLPTVHNLSCAVDCADIVEPVRAEGDVIPPYPTEYLGEEFGGYVEGFVELQYMVKADGHVGDIMVTHVIGPQKLADVSQEAVKNWVYKPATMNGTAIDRDHRNNVIFRRKNQPEGARQDIVDDCNHARLMIDDKKLDEAEALLSKDAAKPLLNFYERAFIGNLQAIISLQRGDYAKARYQIEAAFIMGRIGGLDPKFVRTMIRTYLLVALDLGDVQDATELVHIRGPLALDPADPLIKEFDRLKAKIDGGQAFSIDLQIPPLDVGDASVIDLYWRSFELRNVAGGSLDKLIVSCKQQSVESDITQTAEWHVPKDWDGCKVTVRGAAGTKFQLVQYAN